MMVFLVFFGFDGGTNTRNLDSRSLCILYQYSHGNPHAYTNIFCASSHFLLHCHCLYCILYLYYEAVHELQQQGRRAAHA